MNKLIPIGVAALIIATAASASAQNYGATTGFPIGEKSRVHTNLDLSVAFDSNPRRFDSNPALTGPDGSLLDGTRRQDWRALIRPGLVVDVPGNSVKFNLGANLSISRLLGTGPNNPDTAFGTDISLGLQLGSDDSIVSFRIDNNLVRTPDYIDSPGAIASDEFRAPEWNDNGTARLTLRPGGRALEFDLGYMFMYSNYDDSSALSAYQRHGGLFEARWKFLPKTAFVFHADISRFSPFDEPAGFTTIAGTPFRVTVGAIGQVTTRLTAELTAGYEDILADDSNFSKRGPIGNAILTYAFNEATSLSVGYRRRIRPVVILNGYSSDMPFVQAKVGIAGRLVAKLYGHYEFRGYADNESSKVQVGVGDARLEYWFFEWLMGAVNYRLIVQNPTTELPPEAPLLLQDFARHQLFFLAGFRY